MRWRLALGGLVISALGGGIKPVAVYGAPLLNVRFTSAPVVLAIPQAIGDSVRVYGTLQNDSSEDVTGLIRCSSLNEFSSTLPFVIARGSVVRVWCDTRISTSTQEIRQEVTRVWQNTLGKPSQEASFLFSASLPLTIKVPSGIVTSSFVESVAPTSSVQAGLSAQEMTAESAGTASLRSSAVYGARGLRVESIPNFTKTSPSFASSLLALAQKNFERARHLVMPEVTHLAQRVEQVKNFFAKPAALVAYGAQKINEQQQRFTITVEDTSRVEFIKGWLIHSAIWALKTWWVMLLVYFFIFRTLFRLWRRARAIEFVEDDGE